MTAGELTVYDMRTLLSETARAATTERPVISAEGCRP